MFVGHHWLPPDPPKLLAPNVCCLDYSVAMNGYLAADRWSGERVLTEENFVVA